MKVAVVILNWNGKNFLERFLPSVVQFSTNAQIIVADNNSTDDSVPFLKKHYPSISIISISRNEGFSKGYNLALQQVEAEYYILLNSDVEVSANWIDPIIKLMDSDPSIAACQPKIKSYHHKDNFEYAGAAGGFIDRFGFPFCRGRIFNSIEKDLGQYNDIQQIFWASGACLFVRRKCFHEVKGFDDDFFAHMEEIDLCWRMQHLGYKIFYCSESEIFHVGGGTLSKVSPHKTFLNFRNNLALLYKNLPQKMVFTTIFLRLMLDGIAAIRFLLTGGFLHFYAVLKAHFYFYSDLSNLRKKRAGISPSLNLNKSIYKGIIVYDYYLKGKRLFSELPLKK